ncbi:MAG: multicopper oxidase domain-containing protein [Thermoleophilia bacterium]|nr:multicopper oxidase domain-containing protein [Thermoleophilia bacterium]
MGKRFTLAGLLLIAMAVLVATVRIGEDRAVAAPGDPIYVPSESGGPLREPPVITSQNGVLKADVEMIRAGTPASGRPTLYGGQPVFSNPQALLPSPQPAAPTYPLIPPHFPYNFAAGYQFTTADGTTYPAQFPAPTLRVEPGDTVDLSMHNKLRDEPTGPADGPAGPIPEEAYLTNLHFHGMDVSPLGDGDNVLRVMEPDSTDRTRIEIPEDHNTGMDWYHPHHHGYSADQVYAGLAGAIEVGSPLDPWPQYKGKFRERLLGLTAGMISPDPDTDLPVISDPSPSVNPDGSGGTSPYGKVNTWRKYVNGQFNPTMTVRPGETEVWNLASMGRNVNYNLGVTDANGENPWSATILGYDGNSKTLQPQATTLKLPMPYSYNGPTVLDEGARISMAVTAPTAPGTYYLVDNMTFKRRTQSKFFALATIKVEGDPVTEPPPVFTPTGSPTDLTTATPDHKRTFVFENDPSGPRVTFPINGALFPENANVQLQDGQVEEWQLVNTSPVDHVFHIHQNDFAVMSVNKTPADFFNPTANVAEPNEYTSLRDSVNIPPGGNVVIRFRVNPEMGKFVFHCHILPHEDAGMMVSVLSIPNRSQRRIALTSGRGQRSAVFVRNGAGRPYGRIRLGSGRRTPAGLETATGRLNDDLTEDVVVARRGVRRGARRVLPATISSYDGKSLKRIGRFRPFPKSPRSGVSVTTGDVDGDGQAEIIAGRVGRGPSQVRIFSRGGKLLRGVAGALPGRFPHGVSVASADFNGDNFDDLAIGAGRGRAPRVVGLDGFGLGSASQPAKTLFSFRAPGGKTAGVKLAGGYFDPRTRPGILANLITTPQTGPKAGLAWVWTPTETQGHGSSAQSGHAHSAATQAASSGSPELMARLRLTQKRRPVRGLAVTFLGKQAVNAIVAWRNPRSPRFVSINDEGVVSDLRPQYRPPSDRQGAALETGSADLATFVRHPGHHLQDAAGNRAASRDRVSERRFGLLCRFLLHQRTRKP